MSTIKDNLPTGSERNKVEYLAEQMEGARAELEALTEQIANPQTGSSASRPMNFLKNAAFLGIDERYPTRWAHPSGYRKKGTMNACSSIVVVSAPCWGMEVAADTQGMVANGNMKMTNSTSRNETTPSFDEVMGGTLIGQGNGLKQVLFQVFDPVERPYVYDETNKNKSLWCYLRLDINLARETFRYGVVEIDHNGNATNIVAQKTITPTDAVHIEDWLELGIGFHVLNRRFAFFVERQTHNSNAYTSVTGAGVYWGHEGEVPELAKTQVRDEGGFFQVRDFVKNGNTVTFSIPPMPTRYAPDKHYLFALIDANGRIDPNSYDMNLLNGLQTDNTVSSTSAYDLSDVVSIEGYHGTCLGINFYDMAA